MFLRVLLHEYQICSQMWMRGRLIDPWTLWPAVSGSQWEISGSTTSPSPVWGLTLTWRGSWSPSSSTSTARCSSPTTTPSSSVNSHTFNLWPRRSLTWAVLRRRLQFLHYKIKKMTDGMKYSPPTPDWTCIIEEKETRAADRRKVARKYHKPERRGGLWWGFTELQIKATTFFFFLCWFRFFLKPHNFSVSARELNIWRFDLCLSLSSCSLFIRSVSTRWATD